MLTRRVIKLIDDEAKRDPEKYKKWYNDFNLFLKEGMASDTENKDGLFRLLRFNSRSSGKDDYVSVDDYIEKMQPNQEKIYFIVNA